VLTANADQPIIRDGYLGVRSDRIVWLSNSAPIGIEVKTSFI